ncbi:uncharacterized protein LOC113780690 [Coffea eugenioides]|uniref:uncharacterized protein LOC113780690 n=1 Tax=Coffea eugenioides TaxID=49369 RepID=UPI000F610A39|nr:uncharacterized protein LOC113780690 [Coffea eugenioides]
MANARTLRELAAPKLPQQPLCITFSTLAENTSFELKSKLIHLLPTFHGLSDEEPHKHIQEFDVVCSSMKSPGITEEQIKFRAFPFSLKDAAKEWLYYLPAEICSIKQYPGESLYDYWERFNKLCIRYPQYQISEQLLIQYFYGGLQSSDRSIIDAASGGALANKTPREAWLLIESTAKNSQQFGFRESNPTRKVNEVETTSIQQQLSELTSFVQQLAVGNIHQAKVYGIYTNVGHPTDSCPILQDDGAEQVNMAGGVPAPRREYDPYSNTYNPGWRDHPNFSYGNRSQNSFTNRPPGFQQPWQQKPQPSSSNSGSSLEDIVKNLATSTAQFQQKTRSGMKNLETQMSHMATAINSLESQIFEKLPSQPETNSKNVSTMILRNGKEVERSKATNLKSKSEDEIEKEMEEEGRIRGDPEVRKIKEGGEGKRDPKCIPKSRYQHPLVGGNTPIRKAMLDLGASINVMSKTIYASLNLGPLKETAIIIQLTDRTNVYPEGLVENVLVQVNELVFPADFYILNVGDEKSLNSSPILLGRPFLSTARTKINVNENTLSMKFEGERINFNIFEAMKYPEDSNSVFALSVIESLVQETFELDGEDALEVALTKHLELGVTHYVDLRDELHHAVEFLHALPTIHPRYEITSLFVPETHTKLMPSIVQAPELELKPLPKHLKYTFLGDRETLPVIIFAHLSPSQEIFSDRDSAGGPGKDHIHLPIWYIRLPSDAFRSLQCASNFSKVYALRYLLAKKDEIKAHKVDSTPAKVRFRDQG